MPVLHQSATWLSGGPDHSVGSPCGTALWCDLTHQLTPSVPLVCLRSTPVEWLLGSFAAQNSHLKRDTRLALDQPAEHDFTKPRLRRFGSVHPVRSAFTASFVWNLPLIPSICTTGTV
jgi:hypothetical protein